jgi:hypothetical protein
MSDDNRDQFVDELFACRKGGSPFDFAHASTSLSVPEQRRREGRERKPNRRTGLTNDQRDQFVDELLGASLKQYRGEEPGPGLEMRILGGLRTRQRAAGRRGLAWAVAACAGMLAAIVLTLHFVHTPLRQPTPSAALPFKESGAQRAPLQAAKPSPMPGSADSRFWSPRLVRAPKEKPRTPKPGVRATKRPEQFPTPLPLTEQEKLLLAYLNEATKPELVAGGNETSEVPVTELEIPAIKIASLEIKPLDDSQSEQEK